MVKVMFLQMLVALSMVAPTASAMVQVASVPKVHYLPIILELALGMAMTRKISPMLVKGQTEVVVPTTVLLMVVLAMILAM